MTTDELPPLEYLDVAANLAGWGDWAKAKAAHVWSQTSRPYKSIIAHARTLQKLAKYEPLPVDPAELQRRQDAREAAARYWELKSPKSMASVIIRNGSDDRNYAVQSAYIALCLFRDKTTPIPVEQWGEVK